MIYRVLIAGAGPAGASLAIRLTDSGHEVTLIEREKFPRHKLCGEFISPECLRQFGELGVLDQMLAAGGERIFETRFFEKNGRSFSIPSQLLVDGGFALSLSRARMDDILLNRARAAGAIVIDDAKITDIFLDKGQITSTTISSNGSRGSIINADIFVDATGRGMALSRLAEHKSGKPRKGRSAKPLAVGFKAHFDRSNIPPGVCEIYFFPGGYGGLTSIENGQANLCFFAKPEAIKEYAGDADRITRELVSTNRRALETLRSAKRAGDWLAVSVNSFGKRSPVSENGVLAVGDSAAFIDPFTGSGMLMALESSSTLASAINGGGSQTEIEGRYLVEYTQAFDRRLRVCALLRRAAFMPLLPSLAITFLDLSRHSRTYLANATRRDRPTRPKSA